MSTVAVIVSDLLFQSRITAAVEAAGHEAVVADDAASAAKAVESHPALVIIDLHEGGVDVGATITAAKAAGARVLAFGRHTEPGVLRAARTAGADQVAPRSQLAEELPLLLESLLGT